MPNPKPKPKPKAKRKPAAEFTGATHIGLVVDRSTSMRKNLDESNAALRKWHEAVAAAPSADRTDLRVGYFSTTADQVSAPLPVRATEPPKIDPEGLTALYDATAKMIRRLSKSDTPDSRTLCVVITDGEENNSVKTSWEALQEMIAVASKTGRWTFVFLGAELKSVSSSNYLGMVGVGNASGRGIGYMGDAGALATTSYLASNDRSTKAFFEPPADQAVATGKRPKGSPVATRPPVK